MLRISTAILALAFSGCVRHDGPTPAPAAAPSTPPAKGFALDDDDDKQPTTQAEKYAAACAKAKVPVPPPIGEGWTKTEKLEPMQVATGFAGLTGDLWKYEDKVTGGTCYALTRVNGKNRSTGMICLSKDMATSCLWNFTVDGENQPLDKGFGTPFDCLMCHIQNPFIATDAIKGLPHTDEAWTMINPDTFKPESPKTEPSTEDCAGSGCHNKSGLGRIDEESCGSVFLPALGGPNPRMPPSGPTDKSKEVLRKCCALQGFARGRKGFDKYCEDSKPKVYPEKSGGEPSGDKAK